MEIVGKNVVCSFTPSPEIHSHSREWVSKGEIRDSMRERTWNKHRRLLPSATTTTTIAVSAFHHPSALLFVFLLWKSERNGNRRSSHTATFTKRTRSVAHKTRHRMVVGTSEWVRRSQSLVDPAYNRTSSCCFNDGRANHLLFVVLNFVPVVCAFVKHARHNSSTTRTWLQSEIQSNPIV